MLSPQYFLQAARVPVSIGPQTFGLWTIERRRAEDSILGEMGLVGWPDYTLLRRFTDASIHLPDGEVVMEDSIRELRRHLPIWLAARGRVLKTGLGLGCVVRGLLANSHVEHVDVVEIDAHICRIIGKEFEGNPRVTIHHADALSWDFGDLRWDYAWHDLHSFDDDHLQIMHANLICRFLKALPLERQGAWAFPRAVTRVFPKRMLGAPKYGRA